MPRANRQAVTQTGHRTSCFNNPDRFRIPLLDQTLGDATADTWADIKTPSFREQ